MKQLMKKGMMMWMVVSGWMALGQAKVDDKRMEQDIEVAENILGTLIRQQYGKRNFFPMEVNGSYTPGYGVTFRLPSEGFMFLMDGVPGSPAIIDVRGPGHSYSYSYSYDSDGNCEGCEKEKTVKARASNESQKSKTRVVKGDSLRNSANKILIESAQSFLADYGDVISQLKPEERIVITNRSDEYRGKYELWGNEGRRTIVSAEAKVDDIRQLKQAKISRDQFMSRVKVMNTETTEEIAPDIEVFSSLFARLYRQDLSTTYYADDNVGYERLKDFGVIYYMRVYSSSEERDNHYSMPTVDLQNVTKEVRDQKVKELYPKFESDLKENIIEYGRTIRSLKDDESLTVNVKLTRCVGCGIPSTLEMSIKMSALKDYGSGKATKEATIGKLSVKKGAAQ